MKKKKRGFMVISIKTFIVSVAIVTFMVGFAKHGEGASATSKVIELRFGSFVPPTHHFVKNAYTPWMDMIHKESNNRLKITFFPSGALTGIFEMYDGVVKGIQDIAPIVPSFEGEKFPLTNVLETPFAVPNGIVATKLLYGPLWDKYLSDEYKNVKVLARYASTPYQLFTKKPVRTINDLKGLRIRGTGGIQVQAVKALGATPVSAQDAELYEGLRRNALDGFLFMAPSAMSWRLWEVVKYLTEIDYTPGVGLMIMNKEVWEKLPPDLQLVIEKASKDLGYWIAGSYEKVNDEAKQKFIDAGVEIITLPSSEKEEIKKRCQPIINEWIQVREAKKLPARECYEFMRAQAKLY